MKELLFAVGFGQVAVKAGGVQALGLAALSPVSGGPAIVAIRLITGAAIRRGDGKHGRGASYCRQRGRVECGNNKESRLWITTVLCRSDCQFLLLNYPINGGLANVQVARHGQHIAPYFIQALLQEYNGFQL